jgi:putative CocE/NonD family hydrolase
MRDYLELVSRPGWSDLQFLSATASDHELYHLDLAQVGESGDHFTNDSAWKAAVARHWAPRVRFFDAALNNGQLGEVPRVEWDLGHVGLRRSAIWPLPEARRLALYLAGHEAAPGGRLVEALAQDEAVMSWVHDPAVPVPSATPDSGTVLRDHADQAAFGAREDTLVFTGAVLAEPLDLAGSVSLEVDVISPPVGADLFAKVLDVAPDGAARLIARGQRVVPAGDAEGSLTVDLGHVGYRVRAGHALQLLLCSSDFPQFLPHPGSPENRWLAEELIKQRVSVRVGGLGKTKLIVHRL